MSSIYLKKICWKPSAAKIRKKSNKLRLITRKKLKDLKMSGKKLFQIISVKLNNLNQSFKKKEKNIWKIFALVKKTFR